MRQPEAKRLRAVQYDFQIELLKFAVKDTALIYDMVEVFVGNGHRPFRRMTFRDRKRRANTHAPTSPPS